MVIYRFFYKIIIPALSVVLLLLAIAFCFRFIDDKAIIVLNEICSSNLKEVVNSDGSYPDWIELRNMSDREINLKDYSVYTDGNKDRKLVFGDATIPGNGYAMVFVPFGISSEGDLIHLADEQGRVINSISVPRMEYDTSFSRQDDGRWIRTKITPEYENCTEQLSIATLKAPVFSNESGFYDSSFYLRIYCNLGERIYYTTDGSIPDENSQEFLSPVLISDRTTAPNIYSDIMDISPEYKPPAFNVDKANVIRAVVKNKEGEYSDVVTKVFFVGVDEKEEYNGKTIVSLVCDPEDLFSDDRGIYVTGDTFDKDNPEWSGNYFLDGIGAEREADICVFDQDHSFDFDQKVGIRIKGNNSRSYPQKSLNVIARKAYGERYMKKSFFTDVDKMKSFSLYACAQDTDAKIKDALVQSILSNADFETMKMKPAFLFLNGEYWGIYYITERYDSTYIEAHTGVNSENVIMVKDPYEPQESEEMDVYNIMSDHVRLSDLSDDDKYDEFCRLADEESMIEYYAVMFYIARLDDWPGYNEEYWRSRLEEDHPYNKWRPMLYDLNSACMNLSDVDNDTIMAAIDTGEHKVRNLMQNDRFRDKLCNRIIELSENEFNPDNVKVRLDEIERDMELPMDGYYKRWYRNGLPEERKIHSRAEDIMSFFEQRAPYIIEYAERYRYDPPEAE